MSNDKRKHSSIIVDGVEQTPSRAMLRAVGFEDEDFSKPQAFHNEAISRIGGIASLISLFVFFGIHYLLFSKILYEYIFICTSLFLVGYLDDIKIKINLVIVV